MTVGGGSDDQRMKRRYTHQPMFRSQLKDIDVICDGTAEAATLMFDLTATPDDSVLHTVF
jgi:hypothetical protein